MRRVYTGTRVAQEGIRLRLKSVDRSEVVEPHRVRPQRVSSRLEISERDRRIIEGARQKIGDASVGFADALRALREAVEEQILGGRVFLLGNTAHGPIVGSIVSGLGIVDSPTGAQLVRARGDEVPTVLGAFRR